MKTVPLNKPFAAYSVLLVAALALVCGMQRFGGHVPTIGRNPQLIGANNDALFPFSNERLANFQLWTESFPLPIAPAMGLAMADFTGDALPDIATAKLVSLDSSCAHYWIEVRLTQGHGQVLRLTAPLGGLLIIPRDVSGDGNLDLIVRSAQSHDPVAVFLNDGSGHFSKAEADSFAGALHDGPAQFAFNSPQNYLDATLACTESCNAECPSGSLQHLREQKSPLLPANCHSASQLFLSFGANRAPPSLA
jgi:hypothetical protein